MIVSVNHVLVQKRKKMGVGASQGQGLDEKTLRQSNQNLNLAFQHSRWSTNRNVALMVYNETLPYCNEMIEHLFRYHLSFRTLHFYIIQQIKRLCKITTLLHQYLIKNASSFTNDQTKFKISNHHSYNVINTLITETALITTEIVRSIIVLWKDKGIVQTFELIKKINIDDKTCKINQKLANYLSDVLVEYPIDVQFCEYFMNNILDYVRFSHGSYYLPAKDNLIFNQKHWIDYKLLKQHIIDENKGLPLCYGNKYSFVCFCVPHYDCRIVIFNMDSKEMSNTKLIKFYQKVLITFNHMIFGLPLSMFQVLKYCGEFRDTQKKTMATSIANDYKKLIDKWKKFQKFESEIFQYRATRVKRYNFLEEGYAKKRNELTQRYGYGVSIPKELHAIRVHHPSITHWLIPDLENIITIKSKMDKIQRDNEKISVDVDCARGSKTGNFNYRMNGNRSIDIKPLLGDKEKSFVNHLLNWKDKFGLFIKKKGKHEESEEKELDEANINYRRVVYIRYDRINASWWIKLKKFVFLKDIKCMMELKSTRMYAYNHVHLINTDLSKLVENDINGDDELERKTVSNELKSNLQLFSQNNNKQECLNSVWKHCLQCLYLQIPFCYNSYCPTMFHNRLEYLRIFLNYPSVYSSDRLIALRRMIQDGRNMISYLQYPPFINHFTATNTFYTNFTHDSRNCSCRLYVQQNVSISHYLQQLFATSEQLMFKNMPKPSGNIRIPNLVGGLYIERCYLLVYKFRLQQLLQRKNEFISKSEKQDNNHSDYTYFELHDDQLNDIFNENEFEFENYLRLAFNDYNFAILGLFSKAIKSRKVYSSYNPHHY